MSVEEYKEWYARTLAEKERRKEICEKNNLKYCPHCYFELVERARKMAIEDRAGNCVVIVEHQLTCPKCGWWTDGKWEVYESTTQQKALDAFEGKEEADAE